jgi:hypothetical protein
MRRGSPPEKSAEQEPSGPFIGAGGFFVLVDSPGGFALFLGGSRKAEALGIPTPPPPNENSKFFYAGPARNAPIPAAKLRNSTENIVRT